MRYTDGTVNRWHKLERPCVVLENGHVTAVTLAVIDVEKKLQKGNDGRPLINSACYTAPVACPAVQRSGRC